MYGGCAAQARRSLERKKKENRLKISIFFSFSKENNGKKFAILRLKIA
jgi:hypothetical protein